MKARLVSALVALILLPIFPYEATAIYKGSSALGSPNVVQIVTSKGMCSGTLIEAQILATAAHCVVANGNAETPSSIGVYSPGVDISGASIAARGYQIFYPSGYFNNTAFIEPNDIAFVILDKPINTKVKLKMANFETTQQLLSQGATLIHYGYGNTGPNIRTTVPQQLVARNLGQRRLSGFRGYERRYINYVSDENGSTCPGDSGGPTIAEFKGEIYLVSIHSGGRSPCAYTDGDWGSTATIAGEYQNFLDAALLALSKLRPTDVSNVRIQSSGLNGSISWDAPKNSPINPTGYLVVDSTNKELCRTVSTGCQISLQPGSNLITVFSLAGSISSGGAKFEYFVLNATNPNFIGIDTYETQAAVLWEDVEDFGGASPETTYVEVRDRLDGSLLCSALASQNECRFTFLQKSYNLTLNIKSELGETDASDIGRYSGILQASLIRRTISNFDNVNKLLDFHLKENPAYKVEIRKLKAQLPSFTTNFVFTEEALAELLSTRDKVYALASRITANPRQISIRCTKGKLVRTVKGVKPSCPPGWK